MKPFLDEVADVWCKCSRTLFPAGGELVRGDLPVEYSYNQAEFIAAMNRDVAGVINPEPADDLNTTVNKTKEPTSESSTVLFSVGKIITRQMDVIAIYK